jgi:micrococcal nuclease
MESKLGLYTYSAKFVKVIDGDTIDVDIDLGFGMWLHSKRLRLYGLDTPEKNTPEGVKAKQFTIDWVGKSMTKDGTLVIRTLSDKPDKYGRILASVYGSTSVSLNDELLSSGNAKAYFGGKKE